MNEIASYLGWVGNVFIVIGLWLIGNKVRKAFLFSIVGETTWVIKSVILGMWDLAIICVVFGALALRSYIKWKESADVSC